MQKYVARQNIERFGQLLTRDCTPARATLLRALLCAERAKLMALGADARASAA